MNISEEVSFGNDGHIERFPMVKKLFLALVIILVAALSFGIGRLTGEGSREPIRVEYDQSISNNVQKNQTAGALNAIIASKNGKKYYYSHCGGVNRIKEENKITFATPEAAQASGYSLASGCVSR